jgi:hypothetical protein
MRLNTKNGDGNGKTDGEKETGSPNVEVENI